MSSKLRCEDCKYIACYRMLLTNYYCDHDDRTDDLGKLTADNFKDKSPEWCPLRETSK